MADCSVTIVTGDAVLTACHVAGEVGLIESESDANKHTRKKEQKKLTSSTAKKTPLLLTVTDDGVSQKARKQGFYKFRGHVMPRT